MESNTSHLLVLNVSCVQPCGTFDGRFEAEIFVLYQRIYMLLLWIIFLRHEYAM